MVGGGAKSDAQVDTYHGEGGAMSLTTRVASNQSTREALVDLISRSHTCVRECVATRDYSNDPPL